MEIKSDTPEQNKSLDDILKYIKSHKADILAAFLTILVISGLIFIFKMVRDSFKEYDNFAKELVKSDYPTLLCLSPNGQFRTYEEKTYTVHRDKNNGWNVYWTEQGPSDSSSFHIVRCEIK